MKLFLAAVCGVVSLLILGAGEARAGDFDGVKEVRVVWDITTGNEKVFHDRMGLIRETAEGLRKKGMHPQFVLAIHGPAAKFVTKTLAGTKYAKDEVAAMADVQAAVDKMTQEEGIKVEVCRIAMQRGRIEENNVLPFAVIEDNVWENITVLQNKGYAYMPVF